ncbi:MAG TPA: 16S rRNA (uracil(1498)-N(3))-methyltransferase [Steroidobacteraceae bacterium]
MRLTRVFVAEHLSSESVVELPRDSAAHVAKVLRARSGDELVLFNGDGREFTGAIESVQGSRVFVSIGAARIVDRESPFKVTLVQCVPRGDRMDFIVQKATELGVERIVPVLSQRSVVRLDPAQAASKQIHWRAVAISACEQCGRDRLPDVETPLPLLNYLGSLTAATSAVLRLVLEPERAEESQQGASLARPAAGALIAIGPEGGFAPEELEAFDLSSFSRLGLGPRVLRTETAAIVAIALLQARFGDMSVLSDRG